MEIDKTYNNCDCSSTDQQDDIRRILENIMREADFYILIQDQDKNLIFNSTHTNKFMSEYGNLNESETYTVDDFFETFHSLCEDSTTAISTYELLQNQNIQSYHEEIRTIEGQTYIRLTKLISMPNGRQYREWTVRNVSEFIGDVHEQQYIMRQLEEQAKQNAHLAEELFDTREELVRLANTDSLTGLKNRRSFMKDAKVVLNRQT